METTVIDPTKSHVVAFDRLHSIENRHGVVTIEVKIDHKEHPATSRAAARRWLGLVLSDYKVDAFIRRRHGRDLDGYPSTWRVYSTKKENS